MGKKEEYKLKNEQFLQNLRTEEGVKELAAGVLYRILESGQGSSATLIPISTYVRTTTASAIRG